MSLTDQTDQELCIPESEATLKLQQQALIEKRRQVQMFPTGTPELPLPIGCVRMDTTRGIYHFWPDLIDSTVILLASMNKRENEVLGYGQYSKQDILDTGEPIIAIVERSPDGIEVNSVISTMSLYKAPMAILEKNKGRNHTVAIEASQKVIADRIEARSNG